MSLIMLGFLTYLYRFFLLLFIPLFGTIWCGPPSDLIGKVAGLVVILIVGLSPISMGLYMWYLENKPHKPRIHV